MNSDDPKFTAHVLGECDDLTAAERAEIEALVFGNPTAAAEAAETRGLAARLRAELATEAAAGLEERQRAAVLKTATVAALASKVVPFPRWTTALAALAASLVVGVTAALVYREMREAPIGSLPLTTKILSENPVAMMASNISGSEAVPSQPPSSLSVQHAQQVQFGNITLAESNDDHVVRTSMETPSPSQLGAMMLNYPSPNNGAALLDTGISNVASNTLVNATTTLNQTAFADFNTFTGTVGRQPVIAVKSMIQTIQAGSLNVYTGSTVTVGNVVANLPTGHLVTVLARRDRAEESVVTEASDPGNVNTSGEAIAENAFLNARENPLSTFGADAGTASYAIVRRSLEGQQRPPRDEVRIGELLNYFTWDYPLPQGDMPFSTILEVGECPWAPEHRLVRIGLRAARNVNVQVEFNPAQVGAYRLLGDEGRPPAKRKDLRDRKGAGDISAGRTVTALYEVAPAGQEPATPAPNGHEFLTLKLRYKASDSGASKLLVFPLNDSGASWEKTSPDFRFAAAVAGYGMLLRDASDRGKATWQSVAAWAREGLGADVNGNRAEFLSLIEKAKAVSP